MSGSSRAARSRKRAVARPGVKIGDAVLTPGGFVDFENIYPHNQHAKQHRHVFRLDTFQQHAQGNISEFRSTAQYSRLNLMVKDKYHGAEIIGYVEGDFSGNNAPGVYQSVNPHTNRLRLYFGDSRRGKWEFLGGQTWSWMTPNRTGIGPIPSDLAITYNEDQNIGVGLPYTRAAEFRVAYHANEHWAMGVGVENSNQYIGTYRRSASGLHCHWPQFDNSSKSAPRMLSPTFSPRSPMTTTSPADISMRKRTGSFTGAHATVKPVGEDSFK